MKTITFRGVTLHVPERYWHDDLTNRFKEGRWEVPECDIVNRFFSSTDNVLELGSCLGYVTSILSKKCKKVISIEANPELKEVLDKTKDVNSMNNVEFINGYVDSEHKKVDFQTYGNIVAGSGDREDLTMNNTRGWGHTLKMYTLSTITLDDIPGVSEVNAMMMDIEGGELKFIENHKEFLKNQINKLCVELHGHQMKTGNEFNILCIQALIDMGFGLVTQNGCSYYFEKKH